MDAQKEDSTLATWEHIPTQYHWYERGQIPPYWIILVNLNITLWIPRFILFFNLLEFLGIVHVHIPLHTHGMGKFTYLLLWIIKYCHRFFKRILPWNKLYVHILPDQISHV